MHSLIVTLSAGNKSVPHRSTYRSGRGGDWLKIKCIQSDGFAIVGYQMSGVAFGNIGALLLAARKGGELVYVGSVGTGFKADEAMRLRATMDKIKTTKPAVKYSGGRKNLIWIKPKLVAEIEYRGWTHDGKLRHPTYKGLRDAADNAAVYELE
ncbi:ATP-dependent carboligase [Rhizobium phaseoli]|uniref:DNA ligase (ATP) n=1 Tax=Rhizobium phaseoli TaxID=396 RepID=A0A7X6F0G1_9HYPH|nr:ATP-dependent carboligase [Rhizobium phaseoli]NKF11316.1 ATP-dependent carboligase [Rhizobium phaseoli]PCD65330.1 ATP-dependent carboligase [Rhizobium phaseoli]PDS69039.1 ATP-dependent carboligase [Rhizobium phaseoli]QPK11128.1 ATP-dependent carboligase [Rhizobium phaseoli]